MIDKDTFNEAVIYCRVSDHKQVSKGDGLNSQETRCREFARARGYNVTHVFKDDISGGVINRPSMTEMLKYLKRRKNMGVVVLIDDINRFARDIRGHWDLRDLLRKTGSRLMSPTMEFKDDADSKLLENVMATVAQHQREKNAEQVRNRMKARIMNGYWVFQAPFGYKYAAIKGRSKMLVRHDPVASVVVEAFEGYAFGRFDRQADVMRFLQDHPLFPKDGTGIIRNNRVTQLLSQPVYAGYLSVPDWDIPLQPAQHEPLISFETYQRVQDKLNGVGYAPRKRNVNEDFPLRGFVMCADCGTPLTACWSKGARASYPYYLCPKKGCDNYGKSTRREKLEGEFEELLHSVQPSEGLVKLATAMFKDIWDRKTTQAGSEMKAIKAELLKLDGQVAQLLERIVETTTPSVISAYEQRIVKLEERKALLRERSEGKKRPSKGFEESLRTAARLSRKPLDYLEKW